ncbi:CoA ester lyase [Francisella sp. LA112445]|uniref:HpcH/HpaI aldolase/citrate lyase family protein n=1 Tax=Francisella sp. LA112445 TaxID=1395624 RepID=UPI001788A99B|nr:CoA ester lyase [Francisella sp. LA112445]QIW09751.1 CoA ester lyase [Francisella sp. LA112445]
MNKNNSLMSLLFIPGNRVERFDKVKNTTNASGIIIDLEGTVADVHEKNEARTNAIEYLKRISRQNQSFKYCLRINGLDTIHGFRDILLLLEAGVIPDVLVVSMVESANTLRQLDSLFQGKAPSYIALIESTEGYRNIDEIAHSSSNLIGLALGGGDLTSELGASCSWDSLLYFRSRLVAAAKNANLIALDVPFNDVRVQSDELFREEVRKIKSLGFDGKLCIHSRQADMLKEVFNAPDVKGPSIDLGSSDFDL